ncbi:MAG TPA: hypothetical protein VKT32_16035 [Chthonomonadaceae bacterium]|nr:hypothetical protein [Chthonomonadaceae bacterium]
MYVAVDHRNRAQVEFRRDGRQDQGVDIVNVSADVRVEHKRQGVCRG